MKNIIIVAMLGFMLGCNAQTNISAEEKAYRLELVNQIGQAFEDNYVFPEVGKEIKKNLQEQVEKGSYDEYENYDTLAKRITDDIYQIAKDKHVGISHLKPEPQDSTYEEGNNMIDFLNSYDNFGLKDSTLADGQIGYLEIPIFYPIRLNPDASKVAQSIMQGFQDKKAIIFDLRNCKGGDPGMLNTLIAYLYPKGERVHTNSFYYRPADTTFNSYTFTDVEGDTYPDKPVYVLTSSITFSCGEEFAYDIQQLKRGTLIGETTGGGAHTIEPRKIDEKFEINLPTGRAINPISGMNWEGVGVKPHIEVAKEDALEEALKQINKS